MSSSSSPNFGLAKDNPIDKNNEHTIKILDDETPNSDFTDDQPPGVDPDSKRASDKPCSPCTHMETNARNLIVCIDGTSNQFDDKNTNVIELYHLILKKVVDNQRTWYNSGIGTYATPSWKSLNYYKKVIYNKIDLAIAWDFERTIMGAYGWLSDNYKEDDRIFLFGFSRGAFQVRALSAMIEKVGLIYKGNEMQIPFAYELYADPDSGPASDVGSHENVSKADHFKKTFSNENVKVHFVGAWDTVSSIGIARGKSMPPGTVDGMTHVCYFRHALALDERRVKFLPEYAYGGSATDPKKPMDNTRESMRTLPHTKEVWFAGTHSDIGGGNVDNHAMDRSTPPLRWMVFEAGKAGLRTALFERKHKEHKEDKVIESLTWPWYFFEFCPFKRLTFTQNENGKPETTRWPNLGSSRKILPGQKIHISVVWSAAGAIAQEYVPKAIPPPPHNQISFWDMLRSKEKEPITDNYEGLELDLYEYSRIAVEKLLTEGDDNPMNYLRDTSTLADIRQAVYNNVIDALHKEELTLDNKNRLLRTTMQLLEKGPGNKPDFKLRPSYDIRPLLSDFFGANTDYQRTACDFVTSFTDFASKKVILQHARRFSSCAISPDGSRIAGGLADGSIGIWDIETGSPVGEPSRGHDDWVTSVAFSSDGTRILSGSEDKTIRIWVAGNGTLVGEPLRGHEKPVSSVAFSPNGTRIVSGSEDKTIRIWDAESGSPIGAPLRGHNRWVTSVAFSPDSKCIVSGSTDETIRMWDAETGSPMGVPFRGHDDWIRSVAFSPDGTHIVSGSDDKTIRIWDTKIDSPVRKTLRGHNDLVKSVAFSPDSRRVVSGSEDKTIRIWDAKTGSPVGAPLRGHDYMVLSVAFSPDGTRIVSGSEDKTIRIWDAKTGSPMGEPLRGHDDMALSVAFSRDGTRIASGSRDSTVRIWEAETGSPLGEPLRGHDGYVVSVAFSPDSMRIVSGSEDRTIRIWDAQTGSPVGEPLRGHDDMVLSVAFSPNGTHIVSGSKDETIRIWDAATGSPLGAPLRGHDHLVLSVAFSPDSKRIVSGSGDRTIRIWDAKTGSLVRKPLRGHDGVIRSVAFSPDGTHIVSGSHDKTIRIWDPEIDSPPVREPLLGHNDLVRSVAFSPDGKRIVSGSRDRTVRIWDAYTHSPVGEPLQRHQEYVWSVAFSRDGKRIVSVSRDGIVHIWDAETLNMIDATRRGYTEETD